jgi:hypothetical protein
MRPSSPTLSSENRTLQVDARTIEPSRREPPARALEDLEGPNLVREHQRISSSQEHPVRPL